MAFESFGAYDLWSSGPPPEQDSNLIASSKLAVAAVLGGYGFSYLNETNKPFESKRIDSVISGARLFGNFSPFQIANTFRIPDFLSPYASANLVFDYTKIVQGDRVVREPEDYAYRWTRKEFNNPSTYIYLRNLLNATDEEMTQKGLGRLTPLTLENQRDAIIFEHYTTQGQNRNFGRLIFSGPSGSSVIAENIALAPMHSEVEPLTGTQSSISRFSRSILQAMDMYAQPGFKESSLFVSSESKERAKFLPFKAPDISNGLMRGSTLFRGAAAFSISRFNELIGEYADQLFGESGTKFVHKVLGINRKVQPGPASGMLFKYAGRAIAFGAGVEFLDNVDWLRRNGSLPGEFVATSTVTAGVSYAAYKMGMGFPGIKKLAFGTAALQMFAPGFDQGILQGLATSYAGLDTLRASSLNPFGYLRRTLEGFAPGITDWETGAMLGTAAIAAMNFRNPLTGKTTQDFLFRKLVIENKDKYGLGNIIGKSAENFYAVFDPAYTLKDKTWRNLETYLTLRTQKDFAEGGIDLSEKLSWGEVKENFYSDGRWRTAEGRISLLKELLEISDIDEVTGKKADIATRTMNLLFRLSEAEEKELKESGLGISRLQYVLRSVAEKYDDASPLARSTLMQLEGFGYQTLFSFLGVDAAYNKEIRSTIKSYGFKGITPVGKLGKIASVFAGVFGAHQLITGGALGSLESSEELAAMYRGEKMVEVKSSRYWEGGGTPYEGGDVSYYRPHAVALFLNRTREKGIWGSDEDKTPPILKFILKNFTYHLEEQNYYDRPYPISSAAFQDVPIIGGMLSSTIGRLIKPPRLMHTQEWIRENAQGELEYAYTYRGSRVEPAHALGAPGKGAPVSPFSAENQLKFLSYQMRELEGMTGWAQGIVQQIITGSAGWSYDSPVLADAGDITSSRKMFWEANAGGALFTSELWRRLYPQDPSGMEKTNPIRNTMPSWLPDKFHYGDPYRAIEWGEARLPGAGFAALHPELSGIDPEDYPLIARYAILGDVAPTSFEFRQLQNKIYQRRSEGYYSEDQQKLIDDVDRRVAQVFNKKEFKDVDPNAIRLPGAEATADFYRDATQFVGELVAPAEYLFPMGFRPYQKLMSNYRDPINEYEYERLYGTPLAFWDKPVRDWFAPSFYSAAHFLGWEGKPLWRQRADEVDKKFDQLEFQKWMRLHDQAKAEGDGHRAAQYLWAASNTRMGVNPQGSALSIYWTLPETERKYFQAFSNAQGKERERILEMVPEDQKHLYMNIWSRMDAGDPTLSAGEGTGIDKAYIEHQYQVLSNNMTNPPEDWIGWNEEVDMGDIKVRYVDQLAGDISDYNIWQSQVKKSYSQPFLDGAELAVEPYNPITASIARNRIHAYDPMARVDVRPGNSRVKMAYNDDRDIESRSLIQRYLNEL